MRRRASSQTGRPPQADEDYNAARQDFAEIKTHFGPNHPEYKLAAAHVEEIRRYSTPPPRA